MNASPLTARSENLSIFMGKVTWQIGVPTGSQLATYRGIRIVVSLDRRGGPAEIEWFIKGRMVAGTPVSCDLESAKKIAMDLVDQRIPIDALWQEAEKRDRQSALWKQSSMD
jgi:hypothetical protein